MKPAKKIIYTFFFVRGLEVLLQGREPQLLPPLLLDPPDALRHLPLPLGRLLLLLAPRLVRLLVQLLERGLLLRPLLVVLREGVEACAVRSRLVKSSQIKKNIIFVLTSIADPGSGRIRMLWASRIRIH
jgi:hypothetical protein